MKILHLYHDIMNLYGEYANVSALQRILEKNGIAFETHTLSVNDSLQLMEYDVVYVGSGTERNQLYILEHLKDYKDDVKAFVESGKLLLMTGNSFEIMGNKITDAKGKEYEGLGIFDFSVTMQEKTRNTADAIFTLEGEEKPLVGFVNKCSTIKGINTPLFQVKMGLGNEEKDSFEGIRYQNFYGTHLTGPILIKNPFFLIKLAGDLCKKNINGDYLIYEKAGYEITLRELTKRMAER